MTTKPLLSDAEIEATWERIKAIPPRGGQPFMLLSRAIESAVLTAAERDRGGEAVRITADGQIHQTASAALSDPRVQDQLVAVERIRVQHEGGSDAERDSIKLAYGLLWQINTEPGSPHQVEPEGAANEARILLRNILTDDERAMGIRAALVQPAAPVAQERSHRAEVSDDALRQGLRTIIEYPVTHADNMDAMNIKNIALDTLSRAALEQKTWPDPCTYSIFDASPLGQFARRDGEAG